MKSRILDIVLVIAVIGLVVYGKNAGWFSNFSGKLSTDGIEWNVK